MLDEIEVAGRRAPAMDFLHWLGERPTADWPQKWSR